MAELHNKLDALIELYKEDSIKFDGTKIDNKTTKLNTMETPNQKNIFYAIVNEKNNKSQLIGDNNKNNKNILTFGENNSKNLFTKKDKKDETQQKTHKSPILPSILCIKPKELHDNLQDLTCNNKHKQTLLSNNDQNSLTDDNFSSISNPSSSEELWEPYMDQ